MSPRLRHLTTLENLSRATIERLLDRAVALVDERHSSREAARRFADARAAGLRRRRDGARIDAEAAAVILERWFAEPASTSDLSTPAHTP